ncbi:hypothetical protein [Mesorhizobium sp. M1295]|uniref:hypothetical protein n=1 Tax=Mesorhizobium sp. M1295 TaxID=2957076 RepID=UPI003335E704
MLTRPGDEVGPAGRMLLAGRELAAHPAQDLLTGETSLRWGRFRSTPATTRRSATWPDELGSFPLRHGDRRDHGRRMRSLRTHRRMLARRRFTGWVGAMRCRYWAPRQLWA